MSFNSTENPYGLQALWSQSDVVAHTTLLILVAMSLLSWFVIVTKFIMQMQAVRKGKKVALSIESSESIPLNLNHWQIDNPYCYVAQRAVENALRHPELVTPVDLNEWIGMAIQRALNRIQSQLQSGITVLATIGSTAPFVGLFGTVWGIYHALVGIGVSGQASIEKVAGPVGESLIMTAIGLVVAVPAVIGYNMIVRRNKAFMDELNAFGADFHARLLRTKLNA